MKLRLYRASNLWIAVAFILTSVGSYSDRNDGGGLPWHRYSWLLLLFGAALNIFMAFRPLKHKPVAKPE